MSSDLPGPSRVDALYITYAIELDFPVVTDDQDMTTLAAVFGAKTLSTMQLLKIMFDCQHIAGATVTGLFEYWRHITDLPANFSADRRRLFPDVASEVDAHHAGRASGCHGASQPGQTQQGEP